MLKDFRAVSERPVQYLSTASLTPSGPGLLNSILSSAFGAILVVPALLGSVRFFRRGLMRGGFGPRGVGSTFFAWGRLAAVGLAAALLFSPGFIDQLLPGWRGNVGVIAIACGGLALLSTMVRFCGGLVSCGFWALVLAVIGREIQLPESVSAARPTQQQNFATYQNDGDDWVDMFSDRAVPLSRVQMVRASATQPSGGFFDSLNPIPRVNGYVEGVSNDITGGANRFVSGLTRDLTDSVRSVQHAVGISDNEVSGITSMFGGSVGAGGGSVLPDSAYFAAPYRPSAPMIPSSGGGLPSEFGGMLEKVQGFLR